MSKLEEEEEEKKKSGRSVWYELVLFETAHF